MSFVPDLFSLLALPGAQALGWALVHSLWQGLLIAAALAGVLLLLGPGRPALRYAACCAALALTLATVAGTALFLGSGAAPAARGLRPLAATAATASISSLSPAAAPSSSGPALATTLQRLRSATETAMPWLTAAWLAGVLLLSVRWLRGYQQAQLLTRVGVEPPPEPWGERWQSLCGRLGLARAVRLLATDRLEVPAVVGWLKPVVLVPIACFSGLPARDLEALLAHELAHVRRHDYLANLLSALVEILLFYHPAVRWMAARTRLEREHCCDDLAVATCGDRLTFARALAAIELLRPSRRASGGPAWTVAADGHAGEGALLARVRRVLRPLEAKHLDVRRLEVRQVPRAAAALALATAGLAVAFAIAGPVAVAGPAPAETPAASGSGSVAGEITGTWRIEERRNGKVELRIEARPRPGSHTSLSNDHPRADFRGLPAAGSSGPASFELVRDAGVFHFEGQFSGGDGSGTFRFEPSRAYLDKLRGLGYPAPAADQIFSLALHDVTSRDIAELDALGYSRLPYDSLITMAIHGVEPELIRGLQAAGYEHPPVDQLVTLRIHGVSLELIGELGDLGYARPALDQLVTLKIHGVEPALLKELVAFGYERPPLDQAVTLKIHGASADFIRELGELGYRRIPLDAVVGFRIHGVSPEFIRDLQATGLKGLTPDDLVAFRIHGVDAAFVRRQQAKQSAELDADELVSRRIHGEE